MLLNRRVLAFWLYIPLRSRTTVYGVRVSATRSQARADGPFWDREEDSVHSVCRVLFVQVLARAHRFLLQFASTPQSVQDCNSRARWWKQYLMVSLQSAFKRGFDLFEALRAPSRVLLFMARYSMHCRDAKGSALDFCNDSQLAASN